MGCEAVETDGWWKKGCVLVAHVREENGDDEKTNESRFVEDKQPCSIR